MGGKRDRASELERPSSNEAACVETGVDGLLRLSRKKILWGPVAHRSVAIFRFHMQWPLAEVFPTQFTVR